jgi:phthiocerol/phenolphthiocerol synthesis type-I polyketide synthase B
VVDIVLRAPDGATWVDIRSLRYVAMESGVEEVASPDESATVAWSEISAENVLAELENRMRAILAHELGMPASAVDVDRPFPELGLDSTMAMTVLREAKQLVGFDLSPTMLWDHPTVSSLAACLAERLAPAGGEDVPETDVDSALGSAGSLLDELFDNVEIGEGR